MFSGPNLLCNFIALLNNGANLPFTTLLKSEKSNVYSWSNKSSYVLAYSSAFNVPVVPSGLT
jgi:hypothetical protein